MSDVRNRITSLVSDHPDVVILSFAVVVLFFCAITWLWANRSAQLKVQLALVTQSRDSLAALLPRTPELERNPPGRALYTVAERGVRYEQDGPVSGAATLVAAAPVPAAVAAQKAAPPVAERIDPTSWALTEPAEPITPAAVTAGDAAALWSAPEPTAPETPAPASVVAPWPSTEPTGVPRAASWAVGDATAATPEVVNPFATMSFKPADRSAAPAPRTQLDDSSPIGIPAGTPSWSFVSGGGDPEPAPPVWPASSPATTTALTSDSAAAANHATPAPANDATPAPAGGPAPAPNADAAAPPATDAGFEPVPGAAAAPAQPPIALQKKRLRLAPATPVADADDALATGPSRAKPASELATPPAQDATLPAPPAQDAQDARPAAPAEEAAATAPAAAATPPPESTPAPATPAEAAAHADVESSPDAAPGEAYDAWESLSREPAGEAPPAAAVPADDGAYAAWSAVTSRRPDPAPVAHLGLLDPVVPNGNGHGSDHPDLEHAWAAIPPSFPPGPIAAPAGSDAVLAADVILGEVAADVTAAPTEIHVASEPPAPTAEQAPATGGILLVEDDANVAKIYRLVLESKGHTVRLAVDGVAALEEVRRSRPDLVLLDVMMPRMNGILFLQSLRAQTENRDVPVVILSNFREPRLVERAMALGAVEYVVKAQTRPDVLLSAIPRWMAGERAFSR